MHAGPDSFDKQSKKLMKIARKEEKREKATPSNIVQSLLRDHFKNRIYINPSVVIVKKILLVKLKFFNYRFCSWFSDICT